MKTVRLGIIGLGNIGRFHAQTVAAGKVSRCELTAIASSQADAGRLFPHATIFPTWEALMRSGGVDAVLVATPHWQHPHIGMQAFDAGLHVVSEKPIAAHKADAERFIAAHRDHPELVFAGMFQFRAESHYRQMRQWIQDGHLGELVRVSWINTDWFRPDAYYASSEWRATWRGEGGGVLINQCLHNLDTLQWLVGMPARVQGFCKLGRFHDIEVEDDVTAYLEWANGATGTFVSSTGEVPGTNRLEISGTRGRLLWEHGRLLATSNAVESTVLCRTTTDAFARPVSSTIELVCPPVESPHAKLLQNFVAAVLDAESLLARGAEGIHSLELANAISYSSLEGRPVDLPLDGAAWEAKLSGLIASSSVKKVVRTVAGDVANSFR